MKYAKPHFSWQDSVLRSELFSGWKNCPVLVLCLNATVISVLLPLLKNVGWIALLQSLTDHFKVYSN